MGNLKVSSFLIAISVRIVGYKKKHMRPTDPHRRYRASLLAQGPLARRGHLSKKRHKGGQSKATAP